MTAWPESCALAGAASTSAAASARRAIANLGTGGLDDLAHDLAQVVVGLVDDHLARAAVAVREQVHELRVEPVARRQPFVLVEHLPRVGGELLARAEMLGELLDHGLDQRGETERVLDAGLAVAHADLDRAEVRMRADVVPEVGVVLHHPTVDHETDLALVVGPIAVVGWDPNPRERAEDRGAGREQPGGLRPPERRVRAERE